MFIYRDIESGKTTLQKELCKVLKNSIYVDSNDLVEEFNILGTIDFQNKYNNYDYLLIDNISALLPRKKLFNAIQKLNKRIISSSPIILHLELTYNMQI